MNIKLAAAAFAALFLCQAASAAVIDTVSFTAGPGWTQSGTAPYGLNTSSVVSGTLTVTDGLLTALDYTAGTRTFTLADVTHSEFDYNPTGEIRTFGLNFDPGNFFYSNNAVALYRPGGYLACSGCAAITSSTVTGVVPEPATWLTMIAGFGLLGGALRLGRAGSAPRHA